LYEELKRKGIVMNIEKGNMGFIGRCDELVICDGKMVDKIFF
jgi:hypothetical protein